MKNPFTLFKPNLRRLLTIVGVSLVAMSLVGVVAADVIGRLHPNGLVPNPGTQQQELANITFPAPYNVFEFVVTCAACHSGSVDQQAGHFGNWAGTSMASAARDPIFRANQIGVEYATGRVGVGNMCFRCHSPNGWYSGRFDPTLGGNAEGRTMIHSIVASTDDEGILCEFCHRSIGNVTFKRDDLDPNDPVWNLLAGATDWPHQGKAYVDQAGDPTIAIGNPYGDTSLQLNDGMTYIGKYSGSVDVYFNDFPLPGTGYTGQTYGVYPDGWLDANGNDVSGQTVVNPDGSTPVHFEAPIGPPINSTTGRVDYNAQSLSLEHPTVGGRPADTLPQPVPDANTFLRSSEFCGTCHDLTVPVLSHGMPEQRTYTEWKFSDFGDGVGTDVTCQQCHMPTQKHEYSDEAPVSLNPDPLLAGWFPYGKDRNPDGGTSFHKFAGANRDLPMMMKELYPEPDLEVIGAPTGNDTTIFPGMLSTRDPMYDRAQRNTEVMLLDAVDLEVFSAPTYDAVTGRWTVQVKITNNSGHRIPSGYPDGRRFWINLQIKDVNGSVVYESGHYDQASATLFTDSSMAGFQRALEPTIDSANNAVMVYERVTGTCTDTNGTAIFPDPQAGLPVDCHASPSLLNNFILFDNRILPAGFDYAQLREAGVKFWNYGTGMVPYEDTDRFADGQNWDLVTYTFDAPADAILSARAEVYWQTHTRDFMEHLRDQDVSDYRPEGSPNILDPNYPLNPTYLSDVIDLAAVEEDFGVDLNDNWGGIAYAAWLKTGKGAPYQVAVADTMAAPVTAPANLRVEGVTDPNTGLNDPFTQKILWDAVPGADGYQVWIRYGVSDTTASWDRLAIVQAPTTELLNTALNLNKTYGYQVYAYNGAGFGPSSGVVTAKTAGTLPLSPENLQFVSSTATTVTMSWLDASDNEDGWIVYRQNVPPTAFFAEIARFPSATAFGGVQFTDGNASPDVTWALGYTTPEPGKCYNYVVEAYNAAGPSGWNVNGPVQMCTASFPGAPTGLVAAVNIGIDVDLTWNTAPGTVTGYRIERSADNGTTWLVIANLADPLAISYTDTTTAQSTAYSYRVFAYNTTGDSPASNIAQVTTPILPPAAPANLTAVAPTSSRVNLKWTDMSNNETGFIIQRSVDDGVTWVRIAQTAANTTSYSDMTVAPKTTYQYRMFAFNASGRSAYSNVDTVVTPGEIPQAPSALRTTLISKSSIGLSWRDNATNETGYRLEWSTNGVNWHVILLPRNTTAYTVKGLLINTTYYFRVQAYNADGRSAYSETVIAKTKAK